MMGFNRGTADGVGLGCEFPCGGVDDEAPTEGRAVTVLVTVLVIVTVGVEWAPETMPTAWPW